MYSSHAARDIEAMHSDFRPGSKRPSMDVEETLQSDEASQHQDMGAKPPLPSIRVHEPPRLLSPPEYLPAEGERASWI